MDSFPPCIRVNPKNLDVSDSKALAAIRFGADEWTKQTKAAFRFRYDGTSTGTTAGLNGQNLVLFRNEEGSTPTARASTYTWKLGGTILETDIVFWDKNINTWQEQSGLDVDDFAQGSLLERALQTPLPARATDPLADQLGKSEPYRCAFIEGFSLHANVAVQAHDRYPPRSRSPRRHRSTLSWS